MTARSDVDDPPSPVDGVWTSARPAGATACRGRRGPAANRTIVPFRRIARRDPGESRYALRRNAAAEAFQPPQGPDSPDPRVPRRVRGARDPSRRRRARRSRGADARREPRAAVSQSACRLLTPCHRHGERVQRGSPCQRRATDRPRGGRHGRNGHRVHAAQTGREHGRRRSRCAGAARPVGARGPDTERRRAACRHRRPRRKSRRPRDRPGLCALPARRRTNGHRRRLDGGLPGVGRSRRRADGRTQPALHRRAGHGIGRMCRERVSDPAADRARCDGSSVGPDRRAHRDAATHPRARPRRPFPRARPSRRR